MIDQDGGVVVSLKLQSFYIYNIQLFIRLIISLFEKNNVHLLNLFIIFVKAFIYDRVVSVFIKSKHSTPGKITLIYFLVYSYENVRMNLNFQILISLWWMYIMNNRFFSFSYRFRCCKCNNNIYITLHIYYIYLLDRFRDLHQDSNEPKH